MKWDRLKEYWLGIGRAAHPRIDYMALYAATVVSQHASATIIDLIPDDARLPATTGMSGIPLKNDIGDARVRLRFGELLPKARVDIGFENGDPSKPYATHLQAPASIIERVSIAGAEIHLGEDGLPITQGVVLGTGVDPFTGATYFALQNCSKTVRGKL